MAVRLLALRAGGPLPAGILLLVLISVKPQGLVCPEGLRKLKNSMTS
jgi:hypothetical protein